MKGGLTGKPQRDSGIPEIQWRPLYQLSVEQPRAVGRFELVLQFLPLAVTTEKEVAVHSLELAVDVFHRRDRFDSLNRRRMAFRGHTRALAAVQLLEVVVTVVERRGEMRGSA